MAHNPMTEPIKVLIARADPQASEALRVLLEELGYQVLATATHGEELWRQAAFTNPDLVLMEIALPGEVDGVKTASRIQEELEIPVALVLHHVHERLLGHMATVCPYGLLVEPIRRPDLNATIHVALERKRREILDRRRAEEKLRESERKYRELVEGINDLFFSIDRKGIITYVSPAVESLAGYRPEEVIGRKYGEFIHEEDLCRVEESLENLTRISPGFSLDPIEYRLAHKSGDPRWVRAHCQAFFVEGTLGGIRGAISDITRRKTAELLLQQSEARLRTLFDFLPQPWALTKLETGTLIDVNRAFCELTKYRKEEILGRTGIECGFYDSGNRNRLLKELQASGYRRGIEVNFNTKEGSLVNTLIFTTPLTFGREQYLFSIFVDMTERKRLEEQLRHLRKMEAIGTLAGGIAHDFNNILTAILGYAQLARGEAEGSPSLQKCLNEILTAGNRAKQLVNQILLFSRKTEPEQKPVLIEQVVKEAVDLVRISLPSTIEIRTDFQASGAHVLAEPTQVHQIVLNLCTNARDAMEDGPGRLTVGLTETELDPTEVAAVPSLEPGPYVKLTIQDTGEGMEKAVLDRIFDPFFTTKGVGKGTGMGLSVVDGIVKGHRGTIRVSSKPGQGTTFEVLLPKIVPEALPEAETSGTPEAARRMRILFVDDESALVSLYRQVLERLGHQVTAFTDPRQALEAFRADPDGFDLVITDVTMPHMTGPDLTGDLLEIRPGMPVILCTGFSDAVSQEQIRQLGIFKVLMKPISAPELAEAIQAAGPLPAKARQHSPRAA